MNLHRLIIHEIKRTNRENGDKVQVDYSDRLATRDEQAEGFIVELNNRYRDLRQSTGRFQSGGKGSKLQAKEHKFPDLFSAYHGQGGDEVAADEAFIHFSREAMDLLQGHIASSAAKGGYIVFADYTENQRYTAVFIIRNRRGSIVRKEKSANTFIINETMHIDFEHLAMACRINKTSFAENSAGYLTFINTRNADSQFFVNWICAEELINNVEDTKKLLRILKGIDPPIGENNQPLSQPDFINAVHRFIKDSPRGASTDLKDLGRQFYENENKLTDYAENQHIVLNNQFKPDSGILRQFVNIKAKADLIDLSFPQQYLDDRKIELYPAEGKIVINSHALIEKIQAERSGNE